MHGGVELPLGVVGLGRIGLPLSLVFAKRFEVRAVDLDEHRIQRIKNRQHFAEPEVDLYLGAYGSKLRISSDYNILKDCGIVFVITQTPSLESGMFDLSYVDAAVNAVRKVNPDCLLVVSSTVNVGDMGELRKTFSPICYSPEFIAQGSIIRDFENPKFILIGAYTEEDGERVAEVWRRIHKASRWA